MRTALRKMGNSTGMIVPKSILGQLGVASGTSMELVVEGRRIVATPVERPVRAGWAQAAAEIAVTPDTDVDAWHGFANDGDVELEW